MRVLVVWEDRLILLRRRSTDNVLYLALVGMVEKRKRNTYGDFIAQTA
jgi:hypothetical protein